MEASFTPYCLHGLLSCIERSLIGKNCYLVKGNPLVSGWDDPYSWAAGKCLLIVGTWVGNVRFREGVRVR
jgi:hypothetical protein